MISKKDAKDLANKAKEALSSFPKEITESADWERFTNLVRQEELQRRKSIGLKRIYLLSVSEVVPLIVLMRISIYFYELEEPPSAPLFFSTMNLVNLLHMPLFLQKHTH